MRLFIFPIVAALSSTAFAQQAGLKAPEASPAASDSQTVGITDIVVSYHRPAVAGRKVWGGLVPYGEVWRAGANENTTLTFSTPVKIAGQPLPAGTYGLHAIPSEKEWTVIVSSMAKAWGSYGYNAKEDALRFKVAPVAADFSERLAYRFDDPTESSVILSLHWEKLALPIKIEVNTPAQVMAEMRIQLRGASQFNWAAWNQAAGFWLAHGGSLDEAQNMAERAAVMQPNYQTFTTLALLAEKKGDSKTAAAKRKEAEALANEGDISQEGYGLLGENKTDQAIATFQRNVHLHPTSWNAYDSLADGYLAKGDKQAAIANYGKALKLVKDEENRKRIETAIARLKAKA